MQSQIINNKEGVHTINIFNTRSIIQNKITIIDTSADYVLYNYADELRRLSIKDKEERMKLIMVKDSKTKCYSNGGDVTEVSNVINMAGDFNGGINISVSPYDFLNSNKSSVCLEAGYYIEDSKTMDDNTVNTYNIESMEFIDIVENSLHQSIKAIKCDLANAKSYEMHYKLLSMYMAKEIDTINIYCKGVGSSDKSSQFAYRYIIVITGCLEDEVCIDYEFITFNSYAMNPSKIKKDISHEIKRLNLINASIDEDSFTNAIIEMKKDNPLDREELTENDILNALDSLDKKIDTTK